MLYHAQETKNKMMRRELEKHARARAGHEAPTITKTMQMHAKTDKTQLRCFPCVTHITIYTLTRTPSHYFALLYLRFSEKQPPCTRKRPIHVHHLARTLITMPSISFFFFIKLNILKIKRVKDNCY